MKKEEITINDIKKVKILIDKMKEEEKYIYKKSTNTKKVSTKKTINRKTINISKLKKDIKTKKIDLKKAFQKSLTKVKTKVEDFELKIDFSSKSFYPKLLSLMILIPLASTMLISSFRNINNIEKTNTAIKIVTEDAKDNLEDAGIITIDRRGKVKINNDLKEEDYNIINIENPSIGEAYAYKKVFDDADASFDDTKHLAAIMSNDTIRYNNWEEFCIDNKLTDNNGNPDINSLDNKGKEEIIKAYDRGKIDTIVRDLNIKIKRR